MILSLKKLLYGWSKKTPKANDTATTARIENSFTTVKTVSDNSFLLVFKTAFSESFFGTPQNNTTTFFAFFGSSQKQCYYSATLNVLALWLLFLVVIQERVTGADAIVQPLQVLRI